MKNTKKEVNTVVSPLTDEDIAAIRQNSNYNAKGKAAPDNNIFFEQKSNPLSSKGN